MSQFVNSSPIIEELDMRIFAGHFRTICNCDLCAIDCRFIPGYLLPEDLDKIATLLGYSKSFEFAEKNLLASPGALVIKAGRLCRILTLVPGRGHSGWCRFFDGSLCTIHSAAPFGCAFFDSHQEQSESNTISAKGLQIIAGIWEDQPFSRYCQIWNELHRRGMRAPAPEECRDRMREQSGKS
jgi:hypothetical protein